MRLVHGDSGRYHPLIIPMTTSKVSSSMVRYMLPLAMALGIGAPITDLLTLLGAPQALARSSVALKLRRTGDRVDLIVEGVGENTRVVSQRISPSVWKGRMHVESAFSFSAPQKAAMLEAGLESLLLTRIGDSEFELSVKSWQGFDLPEPQIVIDGRDLVISFFRLPVLGGSSVMGQLDLRRPGRVPQPTFIPSIAPRASAPPLGDIAVGSMLVQSRNLINAAGPSVSLTLNDAPAKDALMSLARLGSMNFVYVNPTRDLANSNSSSVSESRLVSMSFKNEPFGQALNSVLLASGLQGKLEGRTLLVGESLEAKTIAPQMSKVFRLNQVSTETAANYLSSLGAQMSRVRQIEVTKGESASFGTSELNPQVSQTKQITSEIETIAAQQGPLIGLVGTTDGRLGTVTLVGDSQLISMAEGYLRQIDLRKRQVALKVQIISVSLDNDKIIDSSFSSRMGDAFVVSDSGKGHFNFGAYKPGGPQGGGIYGQGVSGVPGIYPGYSSDSSSPQYRQPDSSFYSYLEAQIQSRSAKILAQPTLLIGEGQTSAVKTGLEVVVNVKNGEFEKEVAGLTLTVGVDKIDDNGFVTMNILPKLGFPVLAGERNGIPFYNIDTRELLANGIRLRDKQTLVVSGVISEQQSEEVSKWPILGDLPLVGSLFRGSSSARTKEELVVVVTPSVLDDGQGGVFGYGYRPATTDARKVFNSSQ